MHLSFVYVVAILNFVYAIRSGTDQLLQHIFFILFSSTKSLTNVQTTACLSCFKWPWNCSEHKASKTRQHNNRKAKLVGIEPGL